MFNRIGKWLGWASARRPDLHFLMYTRRECHLCDDAWKVLRAHQERRGFSLDKIDVDSDPALVAKYGDCVPVVAVNGQVRFRGQVNEVLLQRLFDTK